MPVEHRQRAVSTSTRGGNIGRVVMAFAAVLLLALLLGVVLIVAIVRDAHGGFAGKLAQLVTGRSTQIITDGEVVSGVQRLSRLETVVYSLDTVVEGNRSSSVFPDALAGDRLLMIVHGQTFAGVDFNKLRPEDVHISDTREGRSIRVHLPPSEVFLTTVDNAKSRVYARETGLFVSADPNLETAVRLDAQARLQAAALSDGILKTAQANARETVRVLLGNLGFSTVDVE